MSSDGTFARAKNKREDGDGERNSKGKNFWGHRRKKRAQTGYFLSDVCFTFRDDFARFCGAFVNPCRCRESLKFTCYRRRFILSTSGLSRWYVNTWKSFKISIWSLTGLSDDPDNAERTDLESREEHKLSLSANIFSPWKLRPNLIRLRSSVLMIRQSVVTVNVLAKWLICDF